MGVAVLRGIVCPTCGKDDWRIVGRYYPMRGRRVRYFQCLNQQCREQFKTYEGGAVRVPKRKVEGDGQGR